MSRRVVFWGLLASLVPGLGSAAPSVNIQTLAEPDILVIGSKLRKVRITYKATGAGLDRCDVRVPSDARVVDRMMCSLLASCLADGYTALDRTTRCINMRIDDLEASAARGMAPVKATTVPDEWLSGGYVAVSGAAPAEDIAVRPRAVSISPGSWTFTEMTISRTDGKRSGPNIMQWRSCITPQEATNGLARLLEAPPYMQHVRLAVPAACRAWTVDAKDGKLSGEMRCSTPGGASSAGTLEGKYGTTSIVVSRKRQWRKNGASADAVFETSASRDGNCSASKAG